MGPTRARTDGPGDAELIAAVRGGDVDAYGRLFGRHVEAARRLARRLVRAGDVDDLVSDAFARVLGVLQRGGGPDLAFRAYLFTTVRRLHVDRCREAARLHTTGDLTPFDAGVAFRDTALEDFESATAARAFASLPERWQLVLWHTEVEGQRPAELAPLLGMSPNSVAALAYRAREGLRQAFVSQHARPGDDRPACSWTREHLGPYLRRGLARRDTRRVEDHLRSCRACAAVHLELGEENARLAEVLGPVVLGGAAAAYVGAAGGLTGTGGAVVLLGRLLLRARDLAVAHVPTSVAVGVSAGVVTGGALLGLPGPEGSPSPQAGGAGSPGSPASAPWGPGADEPGSTTADRPAAATPAAARTPAAPAAGTRAPTAGPSDHAAPSPTPDATADPTARPSSPAPTGATAATPGPATGADTPGPGARVDLAVSGAASAAGDGAVRVVVRVTGLSDGAHATLRVSGDVPGAEVSLDPRCAPAPGALASCALTGTGADVLLPALLQGLPERPAALLLVVRPAPGTVDRDAVDNLARVPLPG